MTATAASVATTTDRDWPLTTEARALLIDEIARLRDDLVAVLGQGPDDGIVRLPSAHAARRLTTLEKVLDGARLVSDQSVAIGRRATLRDEHGESMTYALVFPGDGDPAQGWISADSPLGAALLGAKAGDVVEVQAPVGSWSVTVLSVT